MASFQDRARDEILSATLLAQLIPEPKSEPNAVYGTESWRCAFAPDESYFAWSCGNRLVTLVPWNRCKYNLSLLLKGLVLPKPGARTYVECLDDEGHIPRPVTIDTGSLVLSMAFGSRTIDNCSTASSTFWTRLSQFKDLVFATGQSNGRIRTWDITGKLLLELMDHKGQVFDLSFSPDGSLTLLSASQDGTLKVWDLWEGGNLVKTVKPNGRPVFSCAWAPHAKSMVSVGACKMAYVWNTETFTLNVKLEGHHHDIMACSYSPDGCLIATASFDTRVIVWDAFTGKLLKSFGHLFPPPSLIYASGMNGTFVRGVSFSRDGAHIATVADDGYLRFWDITKDEPVSVGTVEDALCCAYSPSGGVLAVGDRSGMVSFWQAHMTVKPLLYLCRTAIRRLVKPQSVEHLIIPQRLTGYLLYKEL